MIEGCFMGLKILQSIYYALCPKTVHYKKIYAITKTQSLQGGEKTRNPVFPQRNRGYSSTVFPREEQVVRTANRNIECI